MDRTSGSSVTLGAPAGEKGATSGLPDQARMAQVSAASSRCPPIPFFELNIAIDKQRNLFIVYYHFLYSLLNPKLSTYLSLLIYLLTTFIYG